MYLSIGSSPCDEDCVQVGEEDYWARMLLECKKFKELIHQSCGSPPVGARLIIKTFQHDFGKYAEVCVEFEEGNKEATEYAYRVDREAPTRWKDE